MHPVIEHELEEQHLPDDVARVCQPLIAAVDHIYCELDQSRSELLQTMDRLSQELTMRNAEYEQQLNERLRVEEELRRSNDSLKETNSRLEAAQSQLLQADKMASIGQLAAGVAHEINNPIGYIFSNLGTLEGYLSDLMDLLGHYEAAENNIDAAATLEAIRACKQKIDLEYLRQDVPALMSESKDGIARVKKIVQDLKDFSHVDEAEWQWTDLRKGLNSTLNIVNNEIKTKAEVVREYGDLPDVECIASQLNQVFLNLLVNASHAIESKGTITVATGCTGPEVWVKISDTGCGIRKEHMARIFDAFFTTKPVGKGTGLGLSLSYSIIKKHHGRIEVESEIGKGTTFTIWLPVQQPEESPGTEKSGYQG